MSKKRAERRLGALGVLLEALDQEGGENAVHIDLSIPFFVFFLPILCDFLNDAPKLTKIY